MLERVIATENAARLIRSLKGELGPLIFHQSGGCCEGTAPMCFKQSEFRVGANDVFLGMIEGCPFYIGSATFQYFANTQLIVDVTTGAVDSFSLEAPDGVRFITRSRRFTDEESHELRARGQSRMGWEVSSATARNQGAPT